MLWWKKTAYTLLRKHFIIFNHKGLFNRDDPSYDHLQNILNVVSYLRNKSKWKVVVASIGNDNRWRKSKVEE